MRPRFELIESADRLAAACERLRRHEAVGVDTEFLRERTYRPQACLVQLSAGEEIALVDPLATQDLAPLRALLEDPGVAKVLHAARQDLEVFHALWGSLPESVFDTQLAAAFCGLGEGLGYAALCEVLLDVRLEKQETRTDWSGRPLTPEQLDYAADDVAHLPALHDLLRERVRALGRSAWLEEEHAEAVRPVLQAERPEEAWRSVRGGAGLAGEGLAVLRRVAEWRERRAQDKDLPRRWVLSDAAVLELARRQPTRESALGECERLPPRVRRRHGASLVGLVREALEAAEADPDPPDPGLPSREVRRLATDLLGLARARAAELDLPPSLLASRSAVEDLVRSGGRSASPLLRGWRLEVLGRGLLERLEELGLA